MKKTLMFILMIFVVSCAKEKTIVMPQFFAMGTNANLTLVVTNQNPYEIMNKVKEHLTKLEKIFSRYDSDSEVSSFNRSNGKVKVSNELYTLLELSLRTYQKTKVFDITLLPVIRLWDYKKGIIPSENQINQVREIIGASNIKLLSNNIVEKLKPVQIDLGGIAKGYAAAECYKILKKEGIEKGIIRIGGEILAFGKEWRVGILDPKTKTPIYAVTVKDRAVSTSGDYERFFEKGGKIYSHIIDPRTLSPAQVMSHGVTVIGAPVIDSISTSFFILGPEKSFEILKKEYPEIAAVFIMPDGSPRKSEFFPYTIEKINENNP